MTYYCWRVTPLKEESKLNYILSTSICRIFGVNSESLLVQTSKESLLIKVNCSTVTVIINPAELLVAWCERQLFTHEYAKVGKKTVGMIWSQQYLISVCKIKCLPCKVLCTESYQCKTNFDDFFKLWSFVPLFFACWHVLWKLCRGMGRGKGNCIVIFIILNTKWHVIVTNLTISLSKRGYKLLSGSFLAASLWSGLFSNRGGHQRVELTFTKKNIFFFGRGGGLHRLMCVITFSRISHS